LTRGAGGGHRLVREENLDLEHIGNFTREQVPPG
jgi:hypothetical protein